MKLTETERLVILTITEGLYMGITEDLLSRNQSDSDDTVIVYLDSDEYLLMQSTIQACVSLIEKIAPRVENKEARARSLKHAARLKTLYQFDDDGKGFASKAVEKFQSLIQGYTNESRN